MSENQLKAARIERGQVKAVLTRFARFIDEYTDDKIIQLEPRLEKVEPLSEQFYKIQQKVELFEDNRCQLLEAVTSKYENQSNSQFEKVNRFEKRPNSRPVGNASHLVSNSVAIKCAYCKESQTLYTCSKLKALLVASRYAEIRALKLCTNCLRSNHGSDKCIARGCKYCNKRHNTMLHSQQTPNEPSLNVNKEISNDERSPESAQTCLPTNGVVNHCIDNEPQILLATASVFIQGGDGNWHRCRALIDNGSMPNIITRELSEKLNLTSHQTNIPITGVGKSYTRVSNKITTVIKSLVNEFSAIENHRKSTLTSFKLTQLNIPDNVVLADTQFNESQRIDLLLGADIYHEMICAEVIKLGSGLLILQKTVLGYIVSGPINENRTTSAKPLSCNLMVTEFNQLSNQIERFWKVEECSVTSNHSIEERECEDNFRKTTYRDETGHFIVTLPIKESANVLGESFNNAYQRLQSIERKFKKNEEFKRKYTEFMIEYERKWKSNDPRILAERESVNDSYHITDNNVHRVLGINWRAQNDMLNFQVDERSISNRTVTKRTILATISSIFDPLGLAQPVIITAKILLQAKVGWDETPAADIVRSWNQYRQQLPCLNLITQPRQVTVKNPITIELHGFCDSSERAYGACIYSYIKSSNAIGETIVRLLAAKSRVAPLKRLLQTFWKKWSLEYLTSLQPMTWHNEQPNNMKVGSLVLLADNNLPPLCWKIGRAMECHPGSDGIVRVVTVKTAKGTTKRAIQTLAMFPEEEEEASSSTQC
nr:unnamed protein product [Callosobruchus analis]